MKNHLSDQIRTVARARFVKPAHDAGKNEFSISVREILGILESEGFPRNHTPQICNALQTDKFLRSNGLKITGIDGPKSKTSTTVVIHYSVTGDKSAPEPPSRSVIPVKANREEPEDRAKRLTENLRGLLKKEIAAHGGAEAFIQWVRSDDEDAA
jgi:hypothetical protein